jgi:hypothetical protein
MATVVIWALVFLSLCVVFIVASITCLILGLHDAALTFASALVMSGMGFVTLSRMGSSDEL